MTALVLDTASGHQSFEVVYGWSQALSLIRGHYVAASARVWVHHDGRPVAMGVCDFPGYVDQLGHDTAIELVRHCHNCERRLAGYCLPCYGTGQKPASVIVEPGVTSLMSLQCETCRGTGRLPPIEIREG